jgi:Ca-activated chloride channel family protein
MGIDLWALALALLFVAACYILLLRKSQFALPAIYVSDLKALKPGENHWKARLAKISNYLPYFAIAFLLLAFINPRFYSFQPPSIDPNKPPDSSLSTEGIALYLVLDQSGSMAEKVTVTDFDGQLQKMSKIDLLRQMTKKFVVGDPSQNLKGRPNDLIGLVSFARTAQLQVPLTLDHQAITNALDKFNVVADRSDDGTAIGYAIFKTSSLISATRRFAEDQSKKGKPAYDIKSSVIILVTDGLQDPNPEDIGSRWRWIDPLAAAAFARNNNVKVYIINIEPGFANQQFEANRSQMQKTAELTGGKFYMASGSTNLSDIYAKIDNLEKSSLPTDQELLETLRKNLSRDELPQFYQRFSLYPYLVALGMLCLALWAVLEGLVVRRVP